MQHKRMLGSIFALVTLLVGVPAWALPPPSPSTATRADALSAAPGAEAARGRAVPPETGTSVFPRPASLAARQHFWVRVYSEVGTEGGFLHDPDDLAVVYEVVHYPGLSARARERRVRPAKKRYAAILRSLARGKRSGLSQDERRVLALFPKDVANRRLSRASHRVRFQLGQADKFRAGVIRAGAWEGYIRRILREHGVPEGLAALPHVESSFNPNAHSHAGASGIWQFTRSTGRRYLRVDHVVDERRDIELATVAAARLLRDNRAATGSWPLAITAYNHGAAGVRRAARSVGSRDIGVIVSKYRSRRFGFASKNFYAEFLAALHVSTHYQHYFGNLRRDPPIRPRIIITDAYYPAATLARTFRIGLDALRRANLALLSPVWRGQKHVPKGYGLRIPNGHPGSGVEALLASVDPGQRFTKQRGDRHYRVRRGDTLSKIAHRFGFRESELVALNGLRSRHRIRVGQLLRLPVRGGASRGRVVVAREKIPADGRYAVRRGDSLSKISTRFGVKAARIVALNGLKNRNRIHPGQVLRLRVPEGAASGAPAGRVPTSSYRVARGDTLSSIAKRHRVTVNQIVAVNHLKSRNQLRVGQVLSLPVKGAGSKRAVARRESAKAVKQPAPNATRAPTAAHVAPTSPVPEARKLEIATAEPVRMDWPPAPPGLTGQHPVARTEPPPAARAPGAGRLQTRSPVELDAARFSVAEDSTIRIQPEETLGHYADWLQIPTNNLRRKNRVRDGGLQLGRRLKLDFSEVSRAQFESRRMAYHRSLLASFFQKHRVTGTEEYVLQRGDTLWLLSHRKLSIPVWLLAVYNPEVDFTAPLRVGQPLQVPRLEPVQGT